tara:strand:- start:8083 stop:8472 length:390 start_codon:yes stop_codon:yes gene_type:complete
MIEKLIQLANDLDSKGYKKQADYIDGVITQVHGKGPVDLELGDFSNLNETNITEDEAFSAGFVACEDKEASYMVKPQLYKIYEYAKKLHDMVDDNHPLPDWAESHVAKMDQMIESVYHSYDYKKNIKGE